MKKIVASLVMFSMVLSMVGSFPFKVVAAQVCNTTDVTQTIVSDTTNTDENGNAVALTTINPGWTASIPDATWIWATDPVAAPTNVDLTKTFTKTFKITGTPISGTLDIAADNFYSVKVNGNTVGSELVNDNNFQSDTQDPFNVSSFLVTGSNTIEITVTNKGVDGTDPTSNPAGLLYKLVTHENDCQTPPTTATINVTKIICPTEDLLPNWGDHQSVTSITASTATDFLNAHPTCHPNTDWKFEWAPSTETNPGDNLGTTGGAWTPFTNTVTIPVPTNPAYVWVREQMQNGYVPFSGATSNLSDPASKNSAEMYCNVDVTNYDNFDRVDNMVAGQTYNCVGFNAIKVDGGGGNGGGPGVCDAKQELVTNGSFENGVGVGSFVTLNSTDSTSINNWTVDSGSVDYIGSYWQSSDGSKSLDLNGTTAGSVSQTFTTVIGQTYTIGFDLSGNPDSSQDSNLTSPSLKDVKVTANGVSPTDFTYDTATKGNTKEDMKWEHESYTFVAASTSTTLTFASQIAGAFGPALDNVSIKCTPEVVPLPVCNVDQELITNGSFEAPVVTNSQKWDIFPSGTPLLGWVVNWFGGLTSFNSVNRPAVANIELQSNGLDGDWTASKGTQWTELDSDWDGPTGSLNGEPGAVAISQDITTTVGDNYTVSFDFSPRPNTNASENEVEVLANNVVIGTVGPTAGAGTTAWTSHSFNFTATSALTTITFRDAGTPNNSFGTLLDNVSMKCVPPPSTVKVTITGTLIVKKVIVGNAHAHPQDFSFSVNLGSAIAFEADGENDITENPGTYTVAENSASGYTTTYSPGCTIAGLAAGGTVTCTITNTFIPPTGTIKITKYECPSDTVINRTDNGPRATDINGTQFTVPQGCVPEPDATLGYTYDASNNTNNTGPFLGLGGDTTPFTPFTPTDVNGMTTLADAATPGRYIVVELDSQRHQLPKEDMLGLYCYGDGDTNPTDNDNQEITFSQANKVSNCVAYNKIQPGHIIVKKVTNPASQQLFDFNLTTGGNNVLDNFSLANGGSKDETLSPGTYVIGEGTLPAGWSLDNVNCVYPDSEQSSGVVQNGAEKINLEAGETVTCTFTNIITPKLKLVKNIINTGGGQAEASNWTLTATGPTTISGHTPVTSGSTFQSGTYVLSESGDIANYNAGPWVCNSDNQNGSTITLKDGDNVTCTITNTFSPPGGGDTHSDLRIDKTVDKTNVSVGDTVTFTVKVTNDGPASASGIVVNDLLPAGLTYVSDDSAGAYVPGTGVWTVPGTLASSASATLNIVTTVKVGESGTNITNTASTTNQNDNNSENNSHSATVNVKTQCSDGKDNDSDGLVDANDPGCHSDGNVNNSDSYVPSDNDETNAVVPPPSGGSGGGGGGGGHAIILNGGGTPQVLGASTDNSNGGQVLGASNICGIYLDKYLKMGRKNNVDAVKALQTFLNTYYPKAKIVVDGFFGAKTDFYVRKFQLDRKTNVLDPWKLKGPTGIVYLTTTTEINNIMCPALNLPIPTNLTPFDTNPNSPKP